MFLRSRNEKSQTIEQTARADPQRRRGDIRKTHILYERSSSGGGFQPIRNCRKRVLFNGHDVVYEPALAKLVCSVFSPYCGNAKEPRIFSGSTGKPLGN